jgi:hypothetical protein
MMALTIITSAILLAGCTKDLYDPDYVASKNGLLTGVPSDFNWSTISSVNLTVNVDDQYNGEYYYVIEVFDSNPVIDSNVKLLTKGVAKKGEAFSTDFPIPQTLKSIAIRQTDPTGLAITRVVDVASNITLNFATTSTKSVLTRSSNSTISTKSISSGESDFASKAPAGATEFNKDNFSANSSYTLPDNFSGDINLGDKTGISLYASGKVSITWLYLTPSSKLYLLPGAEVTLLADAYIGQANSIISINSGAKLIAKRNVQLSSNAKILNIGSFTAPNFELANTSSMINGGTIDITEKTLISNNGAIWKNEDGTYTTKNMEIQEFNPNSLNRCKLIITNSLYLNSANLNIDEGAYVSCYTIEMNGARIDMKANAILNVITQANYDWNPGSNNYGIYGPTSGKALLKIKKAIQNTGSYPIIHYRGNLQIECQDHPSSSFFTEEGTVDWVPVGGTSFTIEKSGCSEGNNAAKGGTPTSPKFPITVEPDNDYTFAMEDSWPNYGDYDMNDLVTTIRTGYVMSKPNQAEKMILNVNLRAIGAIKSIGAALQLDNVSASNIASVTYEGRKFLDGSVFEVDNATGIEKGQSKAVIPLFDNAHKFLNSSGITNTISEKNKVPEQSVKITIDFKEAISISKTEINDLNFFIVTDGKKESRTEVHLAGYKPTDKFNTNLLGTGKDNSVKGTTFTSKGENLVWGMLIPTVFNYPIEYKKIQNAYTTFGPWAQSGGTDNQNWYNTHETGTTF